MALVRYRTNDYSVPTAYGFQDVVVKGFVDDVVILCCGKEIARHPRCYGDGAFIADPLHYLALIETKPNALDHAAALQGWALLMVFQHLRHLLEARMGNRGKREFIQVLRLLEALPLEIVAAIPSLGKMLVLELARCEYVLRRENVIALGNSGTGKTHVALALGLAACQKGLTVAFTTAASLVNQLMEARDERRLLKLQRDLAAVQLLIVDELGYVPLSPTGAELLFEVFSQRYERGSTIVTSNLPFEDWTQVLGSERLTGALLDRLTHHVSILTMNGDSYRLKQSVGRRRAAAKAEQNQATAEIVDPDTGEITTT